MITMLLFVFLTFSNGDYVIVEKGVFYDTINPCYMGEDIGTQHIFLDSDWVCDRCDKTIEPRYGFTDDDTYLLTQLLCGDKNISGDGEYDFANQKEINYCEISKVLCVVMNRVRSDIYPNTVKDVILQSGQFVTFPKKLNSVPDEQAIKKVKEWCDAYDRWDSGIQVVPEDHLYFTGDGVKNHTRR